MARPLKTKITFLDQYGVESVVVPFNHLSVHFLQEQLRWEGRDIKILEVLTYEEELAG